MLYILQKMFPYLWPYIKELLAGLIKHPYFKERGHADTIKKFGIVLLLVAFLVLGNEYLATNRELEQLRLKPDPKPSTYVSFEDVRNYHSLFNSPEVQKSLNECRIEIVDANKIVLELKQALELEKILHAQTKEQYENLVKRLKTPKPGTSKNNINDRLNPVDQGN